MSRPVSSASNNQNNAQQNIFKVMLLGDSGVGKTCLLVRFKDDTFLSGSFIATVGIDFRNKTIVINDKQVKLQIYDTAGQERFRSVTHSYYRDANALLLLYDVASIISFNNVRVWLSDINEYAHSDVVVMLIANKVDKTSERVVTREMGEKLASEYDVTHIETSAKTGLNVEFCFKAIGQALLQQVDSTVSNGESPSKTLNNLVQLNDQSHKHTLCCSFS
ncbi:unnamed protein product [Rotaria magnacalcarata]|uniref:Uncharacterized protein n=1 Tax=Rotaria magnacalcarata TaxID=392030 RepID=A0A816H5E6_9BILA|nr:unnamed protein product [Rotaria magnacalcarata]CAF1682588.1 unnamed protein product [Rotaria magnacalcarata]CAF1982237.1 unnamed protein product [Rotaria magnacalcarata]CAF2045551.1 unnamed protein product [Rotaria magnacalcarata]CAF2118714.1 unnamed protein product [Rotaria magnacalcarata]